jgi:deoxyribonuclease-4
LTAGQIFTANQRRWRNPPVSELSRQIFIEEGTGLTFISHASYLINLASSREDVLQKSALALEEELSRCASLAIPYLVLHPGAHQGAGVQQGLDMVARALNDILPKVTDGPVVLLENTAGAGTTLGCRLEELAAIRELSSLSNRTGFCIDTAHAHGAGYQVGTSAFAGELEEILGAENIRVFHLNGSKVEAGSRRDRHEHFDLGTIELNSLKHLFHDPTFEKAFGIAETPGTDNDRAADIGMLKKGTR